MQVLTEAEEFDTEKVDTHQNESYIKTLENKLKTITTGTSQAEVFNIVGQLNTLRRLNGEEPIPESLYRK